MPRKTVRTARPSQTAPSTPEVENPFTLPPDEQARICADLVRVGRAQGPCRIYAGSLPMLRGVAAPRLEQLAAIAVSDPCPTARAAAKEEAELLSRGWRQSANQAVTLVAFEPARDEADLELKRVLLESYKPSDGSDPDEHDREAELLRVLLETSIAQDKAALARGTVAETGKPKGTGPTTRRPASYGSTVLH